MEPAQIRQELNGVFRKVFENDTLWISDAMTANDVPEWDSLNHIKLIVAIEKRFHISFTTKELSKLRNIGEFINLIKKHLS